MMMPLAAQIKLTRFYKQGTSKGGNSPFSGRSGGARRNTPTLFWIDGDFFNAVGDGGSSFSQFNRRSCTPTRLCDPNFSGN